MTQDPWEIIAAMMHSETKIEDLRRVLDAVGYALVPKEPTEAMKKAAMDVVFADRHSAADGPRDQSYYEMTMFGAGYRAMIQSSHNQGGQ